MCKYDPTMSEKSNKLGLAPPLSPLRSNLEISRLSECQNADLSFLKQESESERERERERERRDVKPCMHARVVWLA